jgi:hypothetical protein
MIFAIRAFLRNAGESALAVDTIEDPSPDGPPYKDWPLSSAFGLSVEKRLYKWTLVRKK